MEASATAQRHTTTRALCPVVPEESRKRASASKRRRSPFFSHYRKYVTACVLLGVLHGLIVACSKGERTEASETFIRKVDLDGIAKTIGRHRGRVVVLDVWALWCGPCVEQFPRLAQWQERFGRDRVAVVALNIDNASDLEGKVVPFLRKQRTDGLDLIRHTGDHDAMVNSIDREWAGEVPALFLYDRKGRLRRSLTGEHDPQEVEQAIGALLQSD